MFVAAVWGYGGSELGRKEGGVLAVVEAWAREVVNPVDKCRSQHLL